ncbi:nicotinate-nucleotide--dimethylbenzimidazole phosphoribosyltransferase [Streptomyces sp. KL116D]|uniref:nicotinate-nucleotide--dimethylbenzimidazole phosphoribosyltransferase n=1 Tax=Streptomyces sp. KL116D TaxID=3045152 RepID=UPI0035574A89
MLGDLSVGGTTAAATIIAALCGTERVRGDRPWRRPHRRPRWMRKCAAIRDGLRRARPVLGDQLRCWRRWAAPISRRRPGSLLQSAVRRTPVILDGVVSAACALVGQRVAFRAPDWWLAAHTSGEPGQAKALDRMAADPLLDQGVRLGGGTGGLLALPLVQAAARWPRSCPCRPTEGIAAVRKPRSHLLGA